MDSKKKVIFVSGSTRGIGYEIAMHFAKKGNIIIANGSKNKQALDRTILELKAINEQNTGYLCDLSDYNMTKKMFDDIYNKYKNVDVLINNLGVTDFDLFTFSTIDKIQATINNNLYGYINPTHIVAKKMANNKQGTIINISSVFGEVGASCEVAYSLSKGAINTFTKSLGKELAPSDVIVNAIAVGYVDTEMNSFLSEEEKQQLNYEIPMGKPCDIQEVARLCDYLVYNNSYMVGQVIRLDGGWV